MMLSPRSKAFIDVREQMELLRSAIDVLEETNPDPEAASAVERIQTLLDETQGHLFDLSWTIEVLVPAEECRATKLQLPRIAPPCVIVQIDDPDVEGALRKVIQKTGRSCSRTSASLDVTVEEWGGIRRIGRIEMLDGRMLASAISGTQLDIARINVTLQELERLTNEALAKNRKRGQSE